MLLLKRQRRLRSSKWSINLFKENRFSDVLELTEKIGIEDRPAGLENIIGISKYNKKDLTLKDLQDALLCFERAFLKDKNSIHGFNGLLNIIKTGTKALVPVLIIFNRPLNP